MTNSFAIAERDKRRRHVIASIPLGVLREMWRSEMGRAAAYLDGAELKREIFDLWPSFEYRVREWINVAWEN